MLLASGTGLAAATLSLLLWEWYLSAYSMALMSWRPSFKVSLHATLTAFSSLFPVVLASKHCGLSTQYQMLSIELNLARKQCRLMVRFHCVNCDVRRAMTLLTTGQNGCMPKTYTTGSAQLQLLVSAVQYLCTTPVHLWQCLVLASFVFSYTCTPARSAACAIIMLICIHQCLFHRHFACRCMGHGQALQGCSF